MTTNPSPNSPVSPLARGLWGVLATPFHGGDFAVDTESLRSEVRLYTGLNATGMVVLGVFGEGVTLDTAEQTLIVQTVAEEAGNTPLVVGLSARSTAVAVEQARTAVAAAGSNLGALMVQANSANPELLAFHLSAINEVIPADTGAGIVLQDYPVASGVKISAAQILKVLELCPFISAVKSEAPPTAVPIAALTAATTVPVFGGLGGVGLLDELAAGAAGAMTGFSHPEGLQAALAAFADGGFPAARAAFAPWLPLANFEGQPGIGLAVRKEILRRRGIIADAAVRPPSPTLPPALADMIDAHLAAVKEIA
ncbi:4-hydroxy-tetrahydrodipicolinate synthase [Arthrobacter sp. CAN_A212]|uniref:dihydrodipicolinate synthase family protein n=1 Tax=Arthrobacter sp. CAN_A212 TaxID=2787719 RepID=UPI0018CB7899